MNILAIAIPHSDRHTGDCSLLSFPLGLAYVIASVRKHFPAVNIRISDFSADGISSEEGIIRELTSIKEDFHPDFILFGGMITRFSYIKLLSRMLKNTFPKARLVLGGSAAGSGYNFFLRDGLIDYFVVGEGEEAIIDILNGDADNNTGVQDSGKSKVLQNVFINDIGSIPGPSYKDFNVGAYIRNNHKHTGWKFMPMIASRGCPFSCDFCYPNFGRKTRLANEDSVIDDMQRLKLDYGIDSVYFWDEIQFLDKSWMERFCGKLIKRSLRLQWTCVSRASLFCDGDAALLRHAKRAGCLRIAVGIESGNQAILDRMNKKTTVGQIETSIRIIRGAGIKATGTMLVGYPGEDISTIQDSVDFANRNLLKTSFYCLIPLPGSGIYDHCVKSGIIKNEIEYMQDVSRAGGDASKICINLTAMDDVMYKDQVRKANKCVSKVRPVEYLKYYGPAIGSGKYVKELYMSACLKLMGRAFETP